MTYVNEEFVFTIVNEASTIVNAQFTKVKTNWSSAFLKPIIANDNVFWNPIKKSLINFISHLTVSNNGSDTI